MSPKFVIPECFYRESSVFNKSKTLDPRLKISGMTAFFPRMTASAGMTALAVIWILGLGISASANAAIYYVRQGSSGGCTTTNPSACTWSNAYSSLPLVLERGATYYIADGTYGSYSFNTAEDGTKVITVKKPTTADHGTDTGWLSAYGDGQAVLNGLSFARDYYVVDGSVRNESKWDDTNSYGFRIPGGVSSWPLNFPPGGDHITVQYCDLGATPSENYSSGLEQGFYWVKNDGQPGLLSDFSLRRSHIHNVKVHVMLVGVENFMIEENYFGPGWGKEAIRGGNGGFTRNGTIRNNIFRDSSQQDLTEAGSTSTAPLAIWDDTDSQAFRDLFVYGNVFWDTKSIPHSGGVIIIGGDGTSYVGASASNCHVYNNTVVGLRNYQSSILINGGTGNRAYNNFWYDFGSALTNVSGNGISKGNNITVNSNPFVNYVAGNVSGNFRLVSGAQPINQGSNQGTPFNIDMDGKIRGADGTWDVGAFEYSTVTPPLFVYHPADIDTQDKKISLNEATAYGACWKKAPDTTGCPSPAATLDKAVRAGYLWNASATGDYKYNSSVACPACWEVGP